VDGGTGVTTFLGLTDTYSSFAGLALYLHRVNAGETAVEAVAPSSIDVSDFNDDGTYMDNATHNAAGLTTQYVDTGSVQTLVNKTITNPTIGDFTNSPHDHSNAANGGTVDYTDLTSKPSITDLETGGTWKVFYSDGTGAVTELGLGGTDTYLRSSGATSAPNWGTPTGITPGLDDVTAVDSVSTHKIAAPVFIATVADGTKPFEVTSTTLNTNLNADLLDGLESTDFAQMDFANTGYLQADSLSIIDGATVGGTGTFSDDLLIRETNANIFVTGDLNAPNAAAVRVTEVGSNYNWLGGYMKYDGGTNTFELGTHNVDNNLYTSDIAFLQVSRGSQDAAFSAGLTVADAPVTSTDVTRLTDLTGGTIDADFNSLASGTGTFTGNLELDADLIDVNGSAGTAGQILSSLGSGSGVDWIDNSPSVRQYWLGANYTYESLTATPPATGEIRFNAAIASATSMYVYETDEDGYNRATELGALNPDDWVTISTTDGENARYILSGTPTDNGTYWTVPVTYKDGVAGITDEDDIALDVLYIPSSLDASTFEGSLADAGSLNFPVGGPTGTNALTSSRTRIISNISIVITDTSDSYIGGAKWVAYYTYNGGTPQVNYSAVYDSTPTNITWNPSLVSLTPMVTLTNNTGSTIEYFVTYDL
jgi:hypothetical protein